MGFTYIYPAYWAPCSRKIDYKSHFLPQQHLTPDGVTRASNDFRSRRVIRFLN
jgi:arginyl-tRNA--protein-N-Asp/Glu arginylyltransferase